MKSTPPMPCIGRMSSAITRPFSPSRDRTICDQPPGSGAKIDDDHARLEQAVAFDQLFEFEHRA